MVRSLITGFAAALALAAAVSAADAQTVRHPRHAHYATVHPGGDIVVHARSYLDPGTGASVGEIGTGNRYVTDSAPSSLGATGADLRQRRLRLPAEPLQSARPSRAAVRVLTDRASSSTRRRRKAPLGVSAARRVEIVDKGH